MLRKLVLMEARLWAGLYAWMRRRPHGPDDFPYHVRSRAGLVMGLVVLTTPLAIGLVEAIFPWPTLRFVALVSVLLAFLGSVLRFSSLRSYPHRLEETGVRLRLGVGGEAFVPYARIADAKVALVKAPRSGDGVFVYQDAAYFAIVGETNLVIHLREPMPVEKALGVTAPVRTIHFATDEPKRMIERLVSRLEPTPPEPPVSSTT